MSFAICHPRFRARSPKVRRAPSGARRKVARGLVDEPAPMAKPGPCKTRAGEPGAPTGPFGTASHPSSGSFGSEESWIRKAQRAGAEVLPFAPTPGRAVPVPGTVAAPAAPVGAAVVEPVVRSFIFSLLLFTLPGLFILPVALPPPAAVCASAVPVRATASAAARPKIFVFMSISSIVPLRDRIPTPLVLLKFSKNDGRRIRDPVDAYGSSLGRDCEPSSLFQA